jgi:hypothetical protein
MISDNRTKTQVKNSGFEQEIKRHRRFKRLHGRCHELCGRIILDRPDCWLVQGFVPLLGDLQMEHSWIQHKRTKLIFDPTENRVFRSSDYPGRAVSRYTRRQAAKLMVNAGYFGYWPRDVGVGREQAMRNADTRQWQGGSLD